MKAPEGIDVAYDFAIQPLNGPSVRRRSNGRFSMTGDSVTAPLLHLDHVSLICEAATALDSIDLTIFAGMLHAIIGLNDADKSAFLDLITGSAQARSGRIFFQQHDVTRLGAAERAERGIGRTFQHPVIIEEQSAAEHVARAIHRPILQTAPGRNGHRPRRGRRPIPVTSALGLVGLADDSETPAGQLSHAKQRMLELAVVLAARPRLLLLDEPSSGLDSTGVQRLARIICGLGPKVTIILVDRHLPLVWRVADAVTVLASGRCLASGPTAAIRADLRACGAPTGLATGRDTQQTLHLRRVSDSNRQR